MNFRPDTGVDFALEAEGGLINLFCSYSSDEERHAACWRPTGAHGSVYFATHFQFGI